MGSLSKIDWNTLAIATLVIIPISALACWQGHKLNLLQLGDEEAHYLGLNVRKNKIYFTTTQCHFNRLCRCIKWCYWVCWSCGAPPYSYAIRQ